MSIFAAILLLSGCVTIPLTDGGTLEISADGINVIPGEDADVVDKSSDEEETSIVKEEDDLEEKVADVSDEEDADGENIAGGKDSMGEVDGLGGCANEFYLLQNRLPKDFQIPPCAFISHLEILEDAEENKRMIVAHYETFGNVLAEAGEYTNYFSNEGYTVLPVTQNEEMSELEISGHGIEMTITSTRAEEDAIATEIMYSETPIKQYEIVESIINYTENGYGKCSDEFYTVLSALPDGFPMSECAQVTFLQIENYDTATRTAAGYEVDGFWVDEFDAYVNYAESASAVITQNEGQITQGTIDFEVDNFVVSVFVEKMTMTKSKVHVDVSMMY